jgi:hypothetical protein
MLCFVIDQDLPTSTLAVDPFSMGSIRRTQINDAEVSLREISALFELIPCPPSTGYPQNTRRNPLKLSNHQSQNLKQQ